METILNRMDTVEGWFYKEEGGLLCKSVMLSMEETPLGTIVEVGSYLGRSTVALGHTVKMSESNLKVYAIDPHEGVISYPEGPCKVQSTMDRFRETILSFGLSETVETIVKKSYEVAWDKPIGFIFIDGLHDYENVSRDFNHFEKWVAVGGRVAFHDFSTDWPGVPKCVNEILKTGKYTKEEQVGSLLVLKKLAS